MALLSNDANSMQRLLTKLIKKKINTATSHIRRIIMSEDTSENPAELYGKDGKIYYKREGVDAVEVGGSSWVPDGTDIILAPGVTGANMNGHELKTTGTNDLIFEVPAGQSFIFRKV